jgi:RNA-directed DNA polymerase
MQWLPFEEVVKAYRECRMGKRASLHQTRFEAHLGRNLLKLHHDLLSEKYQPSPVICFVVTKPKPREIFAAHFRDRIVHHLVVSRLTPTWERKFIHSSFACRTGKGTHGALRFFQKEVRKISRGGARPVWALQLDLASFFVTIHRQTLCDLLTKDLKDGPWKRLIQTLYLTDGRVDAIQKGALFDLIPKEKSWFGQGGDQGIPIGNLISQFGANVYLSELDHLIQRKLKPSSYARYMDDLLLLDTDPERLRPMEKIINDWLETNRYQSLNSKKSQLTRLDEGIKFLGFRCKQVHSPKEPLQLFLKRNKKWEWVKTLRDVVAADFEFAKPHLLSLPLESDNAGRTLSRVNSQLGYLKHANTFQLRKSSIDKMIEDLSEFPELPSELGESWFPLKARRDYQAIRCR